MDDACIKSQLPKNCMGCICHRIIYMNKTFIPISNNIQRKWYEIDCKNEKLMVPPMFQFMCHWWMKSVETLLGEPNNRQPPTLNVCMSAHTCPPLGSQFQGFEENVVLFWLKVTSKVWIKLSRCYQTSFIIDFLIICFLLMT